MRVLRFFLPLLFLTNPWSALLPMVLITTRWP